MRSGDRFRFFTSIYVAGVAMVVIDPIGEGAAAGSVPPEVPAPTAELTGCSPGRSDRGDHPICVSCAGIPADFHCARCGTEAEHYAETSAARCALGDDLTGLLLDDASDRQSMHQLAEALCTRGPSRE
jgi:hypothetical protein